MKKIVYILTLILATSCSRNVTNKLFSEERENLTNNLTENAITCRLDSFTQFTWSDIECEFTLTRFSQPDSAGNQYPISNATGKVKKKGREASSSVSNNKTITNTDSNTYYNRTKNDSQVRTEEVKPYVPPWCYYLCGFAILVVVLFIIVWIKKHEFY